ncbi:MAG: hypothetical protein PHO10_03350, partial [Gemmiger sp.]|nr:hypothetical protein [Gemmiger sp.]
MLKITKLWMDGQEEPVGVGGLPLFGWQFAGSRRNLYQPAYRLQIAGEAGFAAPLFDSGRVESGESSYR